MRTYSLLVATSLVALPVTASAQTMFGETYMSLDLGVASFESDFGDYSYGSLDGTYETTLGNILLGLDVDITNDESVQTSTVTAMGGYQITPSILAGAFVFADFYNDSEFDESDDYTTAGVYAEYVTISFGSALAVETELDDDEDGDVFLTFLGTTELPSGVSVDATVNHVLDGSDTGDSTSLDAIVGYERGAISADLLYSYDHFEGVDEGDQDVAVAATYDFGAIDVTAGLAALADDNDDIVYALGAGYDFNAGLSIDVVATYYDDKDGYTEEGIGFRLSYLVGTPNTVYSDVQERFEDFSAKFASY
ncbi:hypothetical protein [Pseudoroseicyclus tamaricis]|uniref:Porin n=1 Tax=Pseudoroseicyclus tamaricis TaxID=2705421 RepID=A0A6B2JJA8_9RHOB|nr:hypothetical protein [Pseudoroseicyclus tamaricis]NDV01511.1 hypothetical protein [Pseudoroseicyclus tamaricis]